MHTSESWEKKEREKGNEVGGNRGKKRRRREGGRGGKGEGEGEGGREYKPLT